jgi:hypothetical protein
MSKFIEVFRHQQPYVAEMVIETLRKNNMPCYLQQGSITGILLSPVTPVAGPGVEYVVFAPEEKLDEVKIIVDSLPIDKELLNVKWIKSKDPRRRRKLWLFWFLMLGVPAAIWFIIQFCNFFLRR